MEQYLLTYYLSVPGKEGLKLKLLLIKESLSAKLSIFLPPKRLEEKNRIRSIGVKIISCQERPFKEWESQRECDSRRLREMIDFDEIQINDCKEKYCEETQDREDIQDCKDIRSQR